MTTETTKKQLRKPPMRRVFDPEDGWVMEADITDLSNEELDAWLKETFPDEQP